jgi:hypothetical protein
MRWDGHVAHIGEGRGVYRVLVGKLDGKRPRWIILTLGRPKWVICDPMSQHFNKFMRLSVDNYFMLRVFLNCVYLLYYATC